VAELGAEQALQQSAREAAAAAAAAAAGGAPPPPDAAAGGLCLRAVWRKYGAPRYCEVSMLPLAASLAADGSASVSDPATPAAF